MAPSESSLPSSVPAPAASDARLAGDGEAKPKAPRPRFEHRRTLSEVLRVKRLERSDIRTSEWDKFGYASTSDILTRPIAYDEQTVDVMRVTNSQATPEWFYEKVASRNLPVIVEGACEHWPAMKKWSIDRLEKRFRHVSFKVGEDDKGRKIRMKFKYFVDYMRHQVDDNPLYLFETEMEDNANMKSLTLDFQVPEIFPHDWLNLMNRDARPPHKWWCIGPKRSGTTVHKDPLGTSAWNAVTHGVKRWVLFEPDVPKRTVKGKGLKEKSEDDEAVMYFDFLLPRIKKAHPKVKVYEGLQRPGDVIFVPGGWWHGVLNTEDCVAVTQNYCGPDNFETVWKSIRRDREKTAHLWLRNMRKFAPQLYARAQELNRLDGFRMRHERHKGERLADASSSSSESSDSSSDSAADLGPVGLQAVLSGGSSAGVARGEKRPRPAASPATQAHSAGLPSRGPSGASSAANHAVEAPPQKRSRSRDDGSGAEAELA